MLNPIQAIQNYMPTLWNMPDDSETQDLPEIIEGDLVSFRDYYTGKQGYGVVKKFAIDEFLNPKYDDTDPNSKVWIFLECAVVVSADENNAFLNYVPATHVDPATLADYLSHYETTEKEKGNDPDMQSVRASALRIMQSHTRWISNSFVPCMYEYTAAIPVQKSQFTAQALDAIVTEAGVA